MTNPICETGAPDARRRECAIRACFAAGIALFALWMFRALLAPGAVLFCTDDNIGVIAQRQAAMPESFRAGWSDQTFIGQRDPAMPGWTNLLVWALPARWIHNGLHALDLGLASFFLLLFLRRRGVGWAGAAVGILAAFWVGSNFTLTYAGHIGKFAVLLFATLFLWLADGAAAAPRGGPARAVFAGGALGAMFLEQADLALFFALALGPFFLLRLRQAWPGAPREWIRRLAPLLAVALLVAVHPLWSGYEAYARGGSGGAEGRAEHREFITQWSWPPEESIDFVAPGFTGWRTGEPAGPYWGRMGRSAGWEETGAGFRNFKLENQYLGILPLAFAAFAAARALRRRRGGAAAGAPRAEILYWAVLAGATLLLAFGKFTPLYDLVLRLPVLSSIRAPVKWLQPFQLAVGVLAAHGVQALREAADEDRRGARRLAAVLGGVAVLFALAAGLQALGSAEAARRLAAGGWGGAAAAIVATRVAALAHGAALAGLAALLFGPGVRRFGRPAAAAALVLVVAADAAWLARHYVARLPGSLVAENAVTRVLREETGPDRVALLTEQGFYGAWLTFHLPYHGIRTLNFPQMPRMAPEVRAFLERMLADPVRYWQTAGAPVVLAPAGVWQQVRRDPGLRDRFALRFAYAAEPAPDGGIAVRPASADEPDAHVVLRILAPAARFAVVPRWRTADDAAALAALADPARPPLAEALVAPEAGRADAAHAPAAPGTVRVVSLRPGRTVLQVSSETPALVRVADRYDPYWRATLDGEAVPADRVDFLFLGVLVPAGERRLVLEYRPPSGTLPILAGGLLACAGAGVALAAGRARRGRAS